MTQYMHVMLQNCLGLEQQAETWPTVVQGVPSKVPQVSLMPQPAEKIQELESKLQVAAVTLPLKIERPNTIMQKPTARRILLNALMPVISIFDDKKWDTGRIAGVSNRSFTGCKQHLFKCYGLRVQWPSES
jgi:hypothetical protein